MFLRDPLVLSMDIIDNPLRWDSLHLGSIWGVNYSSQGFQEPEHSDVTDGVILQDQLTAAA